MAMHTEFIALPDLPETPAELTARARSLIPYARMSAKIGGHKLGRWTRGQTGRRDERYYSAECRACRQPAYVDASRGVNQYGGGAVLFRCAAKPEYRCEMSGVEPIRRDEHGAIMPCELPWIATWEYRPNGRPGLYGMRGCVEHSRTYRHIAATVPEFGWEQASGPTDY